METHNMSEQKISSLLDQIKESSFGEKPDMKTPDNLLAARSFADQILAQGLSLEEILTLEEAATAQESLKLLHVEQLGIKLARSKKSLQETELVGGPLFLDLIVPAYNETGRMKVRGQGNPSEMDENGEDAIRQKSLQLKWLFDSLGSNYRVTIINDRSTDDTQIMA